MLLMPKLDLPFMCDRVSSVFADQYGCCCKRKHLDSVLDGVCYKKLEAVSCTFQCQLNMDT